MGAFFTNIQLKISNFDEAGRIGEIINYIVDYNSAADFIKVDNGEEADKTIIVSWPDDSKWVSIYDEDLEDQGSKKLNKLASGLSKQFKTAALSILVNDSDSMYVGLTVNGVLKDSLSNLSKDIDFTKNKPQVWVDILSDHYSFDDIKAAWQNRPVFVEDFLAEFAKFINLDSPKLITGYTYVNEEKSGNGIKLHFAQKDKKETPELGLTKLSMLAGSELVDVKKGERQTVEWILTNYGSHSKGIDIAIAGDCIEKNLLIPELVHISYVRPQLDKQGEYNAMLVESVSTTGEKIFYAKLEDFYIPKGFQPTFPMSPKEEKRYATTAYDCAIKFTISFIGGNEGGGEVAIYISPLGNRQDGSYHATLMKGTLEEWLAKNSL